jgi:uncharacterized repeat protein (TIGR03803 family)
MLRYKILALAGLVAAAFLLAPTVSHAASHQDKILYNFCPLSNCADGSRPFLDGLVFDASGNLYGATSMGGGCYNDQEGCGVIYELSPGEEGSWTETVLYRFGTSVQPSGKLVLDSAGNIYGTAPPPPGGVCSIGPGCGIVFELQRSSGGHWQLITLHTFQPNGKDGGWPYLGLVFDAAGNLYGATAQGGMKCKNGRHEVRCGTIFELSPAAEGTWTEKLLEEFDMTNGAFPKGNLALDANGNLYGTTSEGGRYGGGVVFELIRKGKDQWEKKTLHSFKAESFPNGGLVLDSNGNLYGTTENTAYELQSDGSGGWTQRVLHNFGADRLFDGLVLDTAGNLYGTTYYGGFGRGSVFELSLDADGKWSEKVLHSFEDNGQDGQYPSAPVIFDAQGNLYSTTTFGGTGCDPYGGCGTVFEITP